MDAFHAEYASLGKAVRDARSQRRLTQGQLAQRVGLSTTRMVRIEKAQGKMTALELIDLARELGDALVLPAPGAKAGPPEKRPPGFYNLEHLFTR